MAWYDPSDWGWTRRGKRKERRKAERGMEQQKERQELFEIERKRKRAEKVKTEKPPHYYGFLEGDQETESPDELMMQNEMIANMILQGIYTEYWKTGIMPKMPMGPRLPMIPETNEWNFGI